MAASLVRHRFSVDDYDRMAEAGILTEDSRVELIEGEIVEMTAIGTRHAACVMRLNHLLAARVGGRVIVNIQDPLRLSAFSEPQPDLALLRPRDDFYARAGITEMWLADLEQDVVEVFRDPLPGGYRTAVPCRRGDVLSPAALPDVKLEVHEILG